MSVSNSEFSRRYGPWALVAGASEGLGEQFARQLASRGLNVVLVARREEVLRDVASAIEKSFGVEVRQCAVDLADADALRVIEAATSDLEIGLLVYNAALSIVGPFFAEPLERRLAEMEVNCVKPLALLHLFGRKMVERGRGGLLLMSSLASLQGSPNISHYAATKAWSRILAEGPSLFPIGETTQTVDGLALKAGNLGKLCVRFSKGQAGIPQVVDNGFEPYAAQSLNVPECQPGEIFSFVQRWRKKAFLHRSHVPMVVYRNL